MKRLNRITSVAALAIMSATAVSAPADARVSHRHHYYSSTRYHYKYCRRSSAATGKVVGGVAGALVGHSVLGHGLLGAAAGGVAGVVAGGAVDRSLTARQRCYYR